MSLRFIALYSPLFAIHCWIQGIFTFYSTSCTLPIFFIYYKIFEHVCLNKSKYYFIFSSAIFTEYIILEKLIIYLSRIYYIEC